jgi:hypothetical protein
VRTATTMSSVMNETDRYGHQAATWLNTLLDSDYERHKTLVASTGGLAIAFIFLCCRIFWYITGPSLSRLPRAGKGPGWLGLGLTEAKRDFKVNGRRILDEGYRMVCLPPAKGCASLGKLS